MCQLADVKGTYGVWEQRSQAASQHVQHELQHLQEQAVRLNAELAAVTEDRYELQVALHPEAYMPTRLLTALVAGLCRDKLARALAISTQYQLDFAYIAYTASDLANLAVGQPLNCLALQVALKAVQKRLNSSSTDGSQHLDEVRRLQGALQQASVQYKQLLGQFTHLPGDKAQCKTSTEGLTRLQTANRELKTDFERSHAQLQESQQQLRHSQEQLQQHMQENEQLRQLTEKLSKAASEMHAMIDRAEALPLVPTAGGFSARHNLQAVHDAVQNKLSRYDSNSSESVFSSTELLLPALWKPQRERHIAPTGFQ